MAPDPQHIRASVLSRLREIARAKDYTLGTVTDDFDLLGCGLLDSYGFLELLTGLAEVHDVEFDLGEMDPAEFTSFGGLVRSLSRTQ